MKRQTWKGTVGVCVLTAGLAACISSAQQSAQPQPFKLGTFSERGETFLGLVLEDRLVVHVAEASAALEPEAGGSRPVLPDTMKELIARYDEPAVKQRLYAISRAAADALGTSPAYVRELSAVKTQPPVMPQTILNAAVNYTEHREEIGQQAEVQSHTTPGLWERNPDDPRWNPYLFLKPPAAVIADGEGIRVPTGRDRIGWECELAVVVGKRASHVPIESANDYIFGYTLENDVSDRGGRGDQRHGTDWLVGKGHDTFAPLGPFIVPKEFVKDPQNLAIKFTLSGQMMQDSNTERMTHNVYELLHFASNILTLQPGDIIATGSPAGAGGPGGVFMQPGDLAVCWVESIGALTNPVVSSDDY